MVDILKECIKMLRRENKVLSWLLIISLLVNVALVTVIYIDNKAARLEKAAATYDITERVARRTECNPIIIQPKSIYRNCKNQSLKHLSTNFYFQKPRRRTISPKISGISARVSFPTRKSSPKCPI
jgi:hypothetical protein